MRSIKKKTKLKEGKFFSDEKLFVVAFYQSFFLYPMCKRGEAPLTTFRLKKDLAMAETPM